jgi:tetratricopeptide (TPR) repeat protein
MNPNSFALLYDDFMASVKNPDTMIDFYHKNAIFFNNIKSLNDTNDLESYIHILSRYSVALFQKKRFSQSIDVVNGKLPFIDNEITRLNAPELKNDYYYNIIFNKAASLNSKRNYKAAYPIFLELTNYDPQNELFKTWLVHTNAGIKMRLTRILSMSGMALVVVAILIQIFAPAFRQRSLLVYGGFIIMLSAIAGKYYIEYKANKNK